MPLVDDEREPFSPSPRIQDPSESIDRAARRFRQSRQFKGGALRPGPG